MLTKNHRTVCDVKMSVKSQQIIGSFLEKDQFSVVNTILISTNVEVVCYESSVKCLVWS